MYIPKKGQHISWQEVYDLAKHHGKTDIVANLDKYGFPPGDFSSDGCSKFPDHLAGKDIYKPCFWHDIRYAIGTLETEWRDRLNADCELAKEVAEEMQDDTVARTMFFGVSGGGKSEIQATYSWGFARNKRPSTDCDERYL